MKNLKCFEKFKKSENMKNKSNKIKKKTIENVKMEIKSLNNTKKHNFTPTFVYNLFTQQVCLDQFRNWKHIPKWWWSKPQLNSFQGGIGIMWLDSELIQTTHFLLIFLLFFPSFCFPFMLLFHLLFIYNHFILLLSTPTQKEEIII